MTRFVVDAGVVLKLASEDIEVAPEHALLAPTLVRSQDKGQTWEDVFPRIDTNSSPSFG